VSEFGQKRFSKFGTTLVCISFQWFLLNHKLLENIALVSLMNAHNNTITVNLNSIQSKI